MSTEPDTILNISRKLGNLREVYICESFIDYITVKNGKQRKSHREQFVHYILPSLQDPGEVWLAPKKVRDKAGKERIEYRIYFLTAFEDLNTVAVVRRETLDGKPIWLLWNFFPTRNINALRRGTFLYRRG